MDSRLELASEGRRVCSAALVKLATGQQAAAEALLEEFGAKCWGIVQGAAMAAEVADLHTEEFDLSGLRVDLAANGPEHDED